MPRASSTCSPAAVVPPGDVTAARNESGVSVPSPRSVLAPSRVWRTSAAAVGLGSPTSTPASIIASARRNTYAGPEPERPVTASSCASGTRPRSRPRRAHALPGRARARPRGRPRGDGGRAPTDERPGVRQIARDRVSGQRGFDRGDGDSRGDREDQRAIRQCRRRCLQRGRHVAGLHRDHEDLCVGRCPRAARDHPHPREALLEHPPALGVDLGDRDGLGLPPGFHEAGRERLTHSTATQQREVHRERVTVTVPSLCVLPREGPRNARCRIRTSPSECGPPAPRASRRHPSMPGDAI